MKSETYEEWVSDINKRIDEPSCMWKRIGIWGYPTKANDTFHDTMIHYCREYYSACMENELRRPHNWDKCKSCGEETPDGIKMIALLEKL